MKKKIIILNFIILTLAISSAMGQKKVIAWTIEKIERENRYFKKIDDLFESSQTKLLLNQKDLKNSFKYNKRVFEDLNLEKYPYLNIRLPLGKAGDFYRLKLIKSSMFNNYVIKTSSGKIVPRVESLNYFGVVEGYEEVSLVALSFFENKITGFVSRDGEETLYLGIEPRSNNQILYAENNSIDTTNAPKNLCYTSSERMNPILEPIYNNLKSESEDSNYFQGFSQIANIDQNHLTVYVETDYGIYQNSGNSVPNVEVFVIGLFNQVLTLYNNEGIFLQISEIFVWDTPDSYSSVVLNGLKDFVAARPTFNGDMAHLLSYRSGNNNPNNLLNAGGIANGIGGLCVTGDENLSPHAHTSLFLDFETVPTFSRQVKVVAHEMGHNLGSRHTHACVWNGNNTAIDGCADLTEGTCSVPGYPSGGGTIMSYCDRQSVGINFNLGFGNQPGDVIRTMVNSSTCLDCDLVISDDEITESTILETCDLEMTNVSIGNNVDLIINHTGIVTLNGLFNAELGATIIIEQK